jgi:hypothetical protein
MPHINHARGETVTFVFRREHAKLTHHTYLKGKRDSDRDIRVPLNRSYRQQSRQQLHRDPSGESILPPRRMVRWLR